MEFTNEFTIPVGVDEAFEVLTDLERVAPCMPGATLEEVDGDTYSGRVKVKVGPMTLTYSGTAELTESDPQAHTARIEAAGREKRGAGTASADVRANLQDKGDETLVTVTTDINVTGKPAQFGRGVMGDVGAKIIDRFADNLRDMLSGEEEEEPEAAATPEPTAPAAAAPASAAPAAEPATSTGPRKVDYRAPRDEALDLMDVAGEATAKRLVPVLAAAVLLLVVILWRRRSRDD
jgi:carbon monoxide dehydrogenase subunit G